MEVCDMADQAKDWIIITDLDGTIIDSESANFRILNRILEEFGLSKHRKTILKGLGDGKEFEEIMEIIEISHETKKKMEERMMYLLTQVPIPSLPGAPDSLRFFRDLGLFPCLVTDNYRQFAERVVDDLGLKDVFDPRLILTSDTYPSRKPSSKIVKELLRRTGRSKAIVLGNTPKEVALARNAGCPAVIILDGNGKGIDSNSKKETFEYEWGAHGGFAGKDVFKVRDWKEAKNVVIEILTSNSEGGAHG
jgi:phosphoglycolate phosphatase-like HAD superfamily hydrolase